MTSIESEERAHLKQVLQLVESAVARADALSARMAEGHRETGAYLADARGELSPEEAHLSAFELNRMDQQAASAALSRQRLRKLLDSPYFARVDFCEDAGTFATYIGRSAFSWRSNSVISDWRSPVASLFYDFEPGPATFDAPSGRREGKLVLKRQLAIEHGQLAYAVDSDSSVRDEVLAHALSRASDAKMHDIVSSIQKEQNAIIRDEQPGTLVIQGVAGSGKTSIALHRIAYLLYQQKDRLNAQSVAILSPSSVFSDYISGVLPELGEEPVRQWSLHGLAQQLLKGTAKVQPPRSFADEADAARAQRAVAKSTPAFARQLVEWLDAQLAKCADSRAGTVLASEKGRVDTQQTTKGAKRANPPDDSPQSLSRHHASFTPLFEPRDLAVGGDVAEAEWLAERFDVYAPVPFEERLDLMAGDTLSLASTRTFGRYAHAMPTRKELKGRLLRMMRAKNPLALYKRFLADTGQSKLFHSPTRGTVEWEDAFPLLLCALAFKGADGFLETAQVKQLVVDEMQDLSPVQHEALARLFSCDKTLLGDVNQLVDGRNSETPEAIAFRYEASGRAGGVRVVKLMRSYRSTWEIAQLAQRVMPVEGLMAMERHGEEPRLVRCGDTLGVVAALDEAIERWKGSGHRTLGIICKSDLLAARYAELLQVRQEHAFAAQNGGQLDSGSSEERAQAPIAQRDDQPDAIDEKGTVNPQLPGASPAIALITDRTEIFPAGIAVTSVRLAKGLEFDEAVLLDVDDRQYATEADRHLLYVAITRAMHRLTILYRQSPSPFLAG